MADLPTPYATHTSCFTNTKRRKVVVEHEVLLLLALKRLQPLALIRRSQRRRDQSLRLATRKQRRPVRARQDPRLDRDRSNFVKRPSIGTDSILRYLLPEEPLAQNLVVVPQLLLAVSFLCRNLGGYFVLDLL